MSLRRVVRVKMTENLVMEALSFPTGTFLCAAHVDQDGYLELTLGHPDLPQHGENELPPLATPTFRTQPRVVFEGWGLKQ